jgi:hypothetical protein
LFLQATPHAVTKKGAINRPSNHAVPFMQGVLSSLAKKLYP